MQHSALGFPSPKLFQGSTLQTHSSLVKDEHMHYIQLYAYMRREVGRNIGR